MFGPDLRGRGDGRLARSPGTSQIRSVPDGPRSQPSAPSALCTGEVPSAGSQRLPRIPHRLESRANFFFRINAKGSKRIEEAQPLQKAHHKQRKDHAGIGVP
jgi:hypothetical protein